MVVDEGNVSGAGDLVSWAADAVVSMVVDGESCRGNDLGVLAGVQMLR